jgi:hypothetical protein
MGIPKILPVCGLWDKLAAEAISRADISYNLARRAAAGWIGNGTTLAVILH